jgi:cobalt-zinc-cadmium resistance protein CzcA
VELLNRVIDWSLQHRFVVIAAAVGFAVVGLISLPALPVDAFPDTTPVQVQVNTAAPGLGAEEVERQLTFPVEQSLGALPRLTQMRSMSKFGISQVVLVFEDGTDIYFARQQVNERLATAELPEGAPRPRMGPITTGLGEVYHYVVVGTGPHPASLIDLRTVQDWTLKPALRAVPGTAEINGWGGLEKQFQVRIDPVKLDKYGLGFDQVVQAVRSNNLGVGGGYLERAGEMYTVRGLARTQDVDAIRRIVVDTPRDGVPVLVGDVARVEVGHETRRGAVTSQAEGEVVLGLGFSLMGENPRAVTNRLKAKMAQVRKTLPRGVEVRTVYDRTELVDEVIGTVSRNLFEGGLLVVAVLFLFLGNLRAGLIVALAIPLSMLFAFSGMLRFGIAGSLLSLGAIDFGLVVDSSVVLVENCVRHLGHDAASKRGRLAVVRDAAVEVRAPTMFGELIIMIVYLPILTLEGVEGKLFRPMALTVVFALIGSLVMSLTLMPVLASLLLPRRMRERDPVLVRLARRLYAPVLRLSLRHGFAVLGLAAAVLAVGVFIARGLGREFVPELSEGSMVVNVLRLPGTSLDEAMRANTRMELVLLEKFPREVRWVWARCGTAEVATDPMGPEETDFFITLRPRSEWRPGLRTQADLVEAIREEFKDLPGQNLSYEQPIKQRIDEMIAGARGDLAIKIYGDDLEDLGKRAERVAGVIRKVPGAADVRVEPLLGLPVLQVKVRQEDLARHNVPARAVLDLVEALGGRPVGEVVEGQLRFPLAVRLPEAARSSPEAVGALLISTPSGRRVPLSRLADVSVVEGPAQVSREWGQRRVLVQCNVKDRDLGGFVEEAQRRVTAEVPLPAGGRDRYEWGGQFENLRRASNRLLLVVPAALVLILVLLYVTYNHLGDVFLVFTSVPFASVGGLVALWLRGLPFSISAGVGFIALSGVSVLNSMVLVTFIRHLRARGVPPDHAIEEAALTRLRPVLMTALVASLGFVPMAVSTGVGAEVQRPLATVVIGGVLSSTLLTLLVLPVLYHLFGPRHEPATGTGAHSTSFPKSGVPATHPVD